VTSSLLLDLAVHAMLDKRVRRRLLRLHRRAIRRQRKGRKAK